MFKEKKIKDKTVYYSDVLDGFPVEHFFSSRDLIIKDNLDLIGDYFKIPAKNIIKPQQTHSTNVAVADLNGEYSKTDALVLNRADLAIYLNFADCTPVVLYDTKNNIASIAHAGWRGTAGKIGVKTVFEMEKLYNTNPENIIALIGPCISFSQFETYDEALFLLKKSVKCEKGLFKDNYADLKGINKRQLEEIGVRRFDVCPFCTVLDNDKFFSYRAENQTKDRHSAVVKLKA